MEIGWILGFFFVLFTVVFIALCIFLPEWVGITGQKAKEIIAEQEDKNKPL